MHCCQVNKFEIFNKILTFDLFLIAITVAHKKLYYIKSNVVSFLKKFVVKYLVS